jgi:hypothetical protein
MPHLTTFHIEDELTPKMVPFLPVHRTPCKGFQKKRDVIPECHGREDTGRPRCVCPLQSRRGRRDSTVKEVVDIHNESGPAYLRGHAKKCGPKKKEICVSYGR